MDVGKRSRRTTRTSAFGSSGRESHDSSSFYSSKLYASSVRKAVIIAETTSRLPQEATNRIFCCSSETMKELPDNCIHLMITSPPYNVGKDYDDDLALDEYRALLKRVFTETYRVLVPGGRACVNIANVGRKPYIPLHSYIILDMLKIGFLMRGEIIWNKGSSAGTSTAWGSWQSASNPVLRDTHEYILVFSKESFSRPKGKKKRENTISKEGFLEWTKSVWEFGAVSAKSVGHPAPFPEELPGRLIQLYSFKGDVVLDPFCGSGTACIAAAKAKRRYVGYDINKEYVKLARSRLQIDAAR